MPWKEHRIMSLKIEFVQLRISPIVYSQIAAS